MIDIPSFLHRIKECANDDVLYLLEKVSENCGFFVLNGNILFVIVNSEGCEYQNIKTEFLRLESNVYISAFDTIASSYKSGRYNYIELFLSNTEDQTENIRAFINICRSFASRKAELDFTSFFDSLVKLFQLPHEQQYKNLVGLYGELSVIQYFFENFKEDLSKYWHTDGVNSKIDFVASSVNIEVKTTSSDLQVFKIKHSQLFGNTAETFLAAVSISESNSGKSLNELIEELCGHPEYCNSFSFAVNLEMEKRMISPKDAANRRFVFKNIKLYNSKEICPFPVVPEIVTDLSYKIDLSGLKFDKIQIVAERLKSNL